MHDENQWTPSAELHWHGLPPGQQLAPANGDDAVEVNEPVLSLQVVHDYALLLRDGIAWLGECKCVQDVSRVLRLLLLCLKVFLARTTGPPSSSDGNGLLRDILGSLRSRLPK